MHGLESLSTSLVLIPVLRLQFLAMTMVTTLGGWHGAVLMVLQWAFHEAQWLCPFLSLRDLHAGLPDPFLRFSPRLHCPFCVLSALAT